jgi:hypothetical protein
VDEYGLELELELITTGETGVDELELELDV